MALWRRRRLGIISCLPVNLNVREGVRERLGETQALLPVPVDFNLKLKLLNDRDSESDSDSDRRGFVAEFSSFLARPPVVLVNCNAVFYRDAAAAPASITRIQATLAVLPRSTLGPACH